MITLDKKRGTLFGTAYGDSLGASTEFKRYPDIIKTWGPQGPTPMWNTHVTDDTQMTLAVAEAISEPTPGNAWFAGALPRRLVAEFLGYYRGEYGGHANRSPGATVMSSLARLESGYMIRMAGEAHSKGCGTVMRVAPVGLMADWSLAELAYVARLQAAITHRHPTAMAAAQVTAYAVRLLANGFALTDLAAELTRYVQDASRRVGEGRYPVWLQVSPVGWSEMAEAMAALRLALQVDDRYADPCELTGDGWTADECLATALHCLLLFPDDPVSAIRRAAATEGDSDSIAAVTGALAGAAYGMSAWPAWWRDRIEFSQELEAAARNL